MTLIQLQEAAIRAMLEPRTSEKRAAKHRTAVVRKYRTQALALGYTAEQAQTQCKDIRDMYALEVAAQDEE